MEDSDVDADVDVRDPDEKSIMTYVAQFLQYSRDLPVSEEEMQVCISALHKPLKRCSCFWHIFSETFQLVWTV